MAAALRLDYETYSELDIGRVGAHKYARHPGTHILLASWKLEGDNELHTWDATVVPVPPVEFIALLNNPAVIIHAFNATFERLITEHVLNIRIPPDRWRCTMVRAYQYSFKGTMAEVGTQLRIPSELLKYDTGRKLINRFCKPAPRNHNADRYDRHSHPEEWEQFVQYNRQDVLAEEAIDAALDGYPPQPPMERALYVLDQQINDAGVPVDLDLIHAAQDIAKQVKNQLLVRHKRLTGLVNPNSSAQLIQWLLDRGIQVPKKYSWRTKLTSHTLDKDNLAVLIDDVAAGEHSSLWATDDILEVLRLKQQLSKVSVSKYDAFERAAEQGYVRGMFQISGAQRTSRWAGRVVQLHNLARPKETNADTLADVILQRNPDLLECLYGDAMGVLSGAVRAVIKAPDEQQLEVADLGSIESRMLGWHSGCQRINDTFANGLDTYKDFAVELFGKPYDTITKSERTYSKPPTLGCGYRLGGKTLMDYAAGMGVDMERSDAYRAVRLYRESYPEVPAMWYWLETAVEAAITTGTPASGYGVQISMVHDMLCITLPSSRVLYYHEPAMEMQTITFELEDGSTRTIEKPCFTFNGTDKWKPHVWSRVSAHGGVLTENIIQASARDILAVWMLRCADAGFDIRLHVHDEIGCLAPTGVVGDQLSTMLALIRRPIAFCPGLLLDAAGYTAVRYRKD